MAEVLDNIQREWGEPPEEYFDSLGYDYTPDERLGEPHDLATERGELVEAIDESQLPTPEAWVVIADRPIKFVMLEIFLRGDVGYGEDDYRQDLMCGLFSAVPDYDPRKASPATYAGSVIMKTAIDLLRHHTAAMRTPGSRVHVNDKDSDRERRNGLLDIGRPLADCHRALAANPLDKAIESIYSDELMRLMDEANLTDLERAAVARKIFYNGQAKKESDTSLAPLTALSSAWVRAREKMASVTVDSGYSIFCEPDC